jgi:hypothetical protein
LDAFLMIALLNSFPCVTIITPEQVRLKLAAMKPGPVPAPTSTIFAIFYGIDVVAQPEVYSRPGQTGTFIGRCVNRTALEKAKACPFKHLSAAGFGGQYPSVIVALMACLASFGLIIVRTIYKKLPK